VVIQANRGFGDLVCDSVLFRALAERAPTMRITAIVRSPAHAELLGAHPGIEGFLFFDADGDGYVTSATRLCWRVRRLRPEVFIASVGNDLKKSPLLGWTSGARFRVGEAGGLGRRFHTHSADVPADLHKVEGNRALLRAMGIDDSVEPWIPRSPADVAAVDDMVGDTGRCVAFHAGSRRIDEFKRWPPDRFAALARRLEEREYRVLLVGTEDEARTNARIHAMAPRSVDLSCRLRPRELAELLSRCAVVVGNDSGPMHMAAATGALTVTLFGPTDPVRTEPFGRRGRMVRRALSCSPCFPALRFGCGDPQCLRGMTVTEVLRVVDEALESGGEGRAGDPSLEESKR
jgi:ADP-heptose:LPS heptosyltransferase